MSPLEGAPADSPRRVDLAFAVDAGYVPYLGVVLASLASVGLTPGVHYAAHVLADDVGPRARGELAEIADRSGVSLHWRTPPSGFAHGFPRKVGISRAAYFRLVLDELVPDDVTRVLYVDTDTLFRRDPLPLFETVLEGLPFGAVRSGHCPWLASPAGVAGWRDFGLHPDAPFFNSGVLLIDVSAWRSASIGRRALAYIEDRGGALEGGDQEALNAAANGDFLELPPIWNQQPYLFRQRSHAHAIWSQSEVTSAIEEPGIVHYIGQDKPWVSSAHPQASLWHEVAVDTPWTGRSRPVSLPLRRLVRRIGLAGRVLRHGSIRRPMERRK